MFQNKANDFEGSKASTAPELRIPTNKIKCICKRSLKLKSKYDKVLFNFNCGICGLSNPDSFYKCKDEEGEQPNKCQFFMCKPCMADIQVRDKMKLMTIARSKLNDEKFTEIIDYLLGIFREQEINSPIA